GRRSVSEAQDGDRRASLLPRAHPPPRRAPVRLPGGVPGGSCPGPAPERRALSPLRRAVVTGTRHPPASADRTRRRGPLRPPAPRGRLRPGVNQPRTRLPPPGLQRGDWRPPGRCEPGPRREALPGKQSAGPLADRRGGATAPHDARGGALAKGRGRAPYGLPAFQLLPPPVGRRRELRLGFPARAPAEGR